MKRKRRQYSGALKAKVGLEAIIGIKTTAQIAREYQVHPLLVTQWKKVLRDRMPEIFEKGKSVEDDSICVCGVKPCVCVCGVKPYI